ncbi:hypothetical protein BX600DRAFT_464497 [Xylariales sp. PMI_506]|nr:hypothetical protein BX600DRAFT_464497 [Xylariales sp. PMI_506]
MIQNVLQNQGEVLEAMMSSLKHQLETNMTEMAKKELKSVVLKPNRTLEIMLRRWQRLEEDAQRVENSLNHLLDLKQKQANINEAESSSEEAKNSARQNKAVLVFTVVTIIFTPLSFVTSLYALDYFQPPEGSRHVTTGWNQNDLGKGLGLAEAITIAVICIIVAGAVLLEGWRPFRKKRIPPHTTERTMAKSSLKG